MDSQATLLPPTPPPAVISSHKIAFPSHATADFLNELSSHSTHLCKLTITHCPTTLNASKLLSSESFQKAIQSLSNLTVIKVEIDGDFISRDIAPPSRHSFTSQDRILVSYQSVVDKRQLVVYCINETSDDYARFAFAGELSAELTTFVLDFLVRTISDCNEVDYSAFASTSFPLVFMKDSRGYNLLMTAIEEGNRAIFSQLIAHPFMLHETSNDGESAADIAWNGKDQETLLTLLNKNSPFPERFTESEATNEIRTFILTANSAHFFVKCRMEEQLRQILKNNSHLRHFYSTNNESAAAVALTLKSSNFYKILIESNCTTGPNEDVDSLIDQLAECDEYSVDSKVLRRDGMTSIHDSNSRELPDSYLSVHIARSTASADEHHAQLQSGHLRRVYELISESEEGKLCLQVTANCDIVRPIFDFRRDHVRFVSPSGTDRSTLGLFNMRNFRIYLGMRRITSDESELAGSANHEFHHLCMEFVFGNDAKPYAFGDFANCKEFKKIVRKCMKSRFEESLVKWVYDSYPPNMWHAELIVRVPHMTTSYRDDGDRLEECRRQYGRLFRYYHGIVVPAMREALPVLQKLRRNAVEVKFSDLTDALRSSVLNAEVRFQGSLVRLRKIVKDGNSPVLDCLTTQNLHTVIIKRETLTLAQPIEALTRVYIERTFERSETEFDFNEVRAEGALVLLSDHAGCGKTTTFRHIAFMLKREHKHHWVHYVDLKRSIKVYERHKSAVNRQTLALILVEIMDIEGDKLASALFRDRLEADRVILLFDGVDEIAPTYKEFFVSLIRVVRATTECQQWIATRPVHREELEREFNAVAFALRPLTEDDIKRMIGMADCTGATVEATYQYIRSLSTELLETSNPLLIRLIAELSSRVPLDAVNSYGLYARIVEAKFELLAEKGRVVNSDRDNDASLSITRVHQVYAIALLKDEDDDIYELLRNFPGLRGWRRDRRKWTPEKISRYGFLFVDHWNEVGEWPAFTHRTFAEFFLGKFLIESLFELEADDDEVSVEEIRAVMSLAISVKESDFIRDLIDGHVKSQSDRKGKLHPKVLEVLKEEDFKNRLSHFMASYYGEHKIIPLIRLLSCDCDAAKEIARYTADRTFFQHCFVNEDAAFKVANLLEVFKTCQLPDWVDRLGYSPLQTTFTEKFDLLCEDFERLTENADQIYLFLLKSLDMPRADKTRSLVNNKNEVLKSISFAPSMGLLLLDELQKCDLTREQLCELMCPEYDYYDYAPSDVDLLQAIDKCLLSIEKMLACDEALMKRFLLCKHSFVHNPEFYVRLPALREMLRKYCTSAELQDAILSHSERICISLYNLSEELVLGFCEFLAKVFGGEGIERFLSCKFDETLSLGGYMETVAKEHKNFEVFLSYFHGLSSKVLECESFQDCEVMSA